MIVHNLVISNLNLCKLLEMRQNVKNLSYKSKCMKNLGPLKRLVEATGQEIFNLLIIINYKKNTYHFGI